MIGTSLSHYRITEKLGAGGMGEVYRAEDTNLSRQVAIKVLPDEFAHDAERLARFEREAKLLASLNHPNIASIYGLEEHEGKRFLVLELVEGHTLAHRLLKGPLPVEEALEVCRQIAEGLEAAHEKGIIHRDLKPANVKVTPEGKVKILDFGLAKAFYEQAAPLDPSRSPTITEQMTAPGVILGTAAYMSPEQAKGRAVDKRADIWAFGCVLYECLTGKRAFQGDTITETVAAILKSEPDWTLLPAETSALVRSLLRQCLQKDPGLRLRDIGDVRVEMREELVEASSVIPVAQRFPLGWILSTGAATLLIGILTGPAVTKYFRHAASPTPQPVVRFPVRLEPSHRLDGLRMSPPYGFDQPTRTAMAISSDARFIVYSAVKENPGPQDKSRLYLRRLDQLQARPIAGTEGGSNPFLSPDDRWIGFWTDGKLMKVSIDGGVPTPLCNADLMFGASWASDNSVIFAPVAGSGLFRISAEGGDPESLTTPDKMMEEYSHRLPHCLPDGKSLLFTIMRVDIDLQPRIAWLDLKTRKWHVLMVDAADARYAPTGHLVFLRQGTLMVVPFDLGRHEVTGQPVPAIANVMQALNVLNTDYNTAAGQFSISDSGWLVFAEGGILPDAQNSLVWMDRQGGAEPIASFKAPIYSPRLAPDGRRLAYTTVGIENRLSIYDPDRGTTGPLTGEGRAFWANWTPDGKRVVFDWSKSGQHNLYWQPADGSSGMERLTTSDSSQYPGSWSPDGTTLAFAVEGQPETGNDILLLDVRSHRVTPFLNSRADERYPEFSPDGRWMAYVSMESGREEVYVRPFPGPGGKWQISHQGGREPLWARDGKQLFYRSWEEGDWPLVWAVDVRTDGGLSPSRPRLLFRAPGLGVGSPIRAWDLSLDGRRFLMVRLEERKSHPATEMILVQNWFEELKRLCPTGKK